MPAANKERIKHYLMERDARLSPISMSLAYPVTRHERDIYGALEHSIVSQQLSIKVAAAIHARLLALFPDADAHPGLLIGKICYSHNLPSGIVELS